MPPFHSPQRRILSICSKPVRRTCHARPHSSTRQFQVDSKIRTTVVACMSILVLRWGPGMMRKHFPCHSANFKGLVKFVDFRRISPHFHNFSYSSERRPLWSIHMDVHKAFMLLSLLYCKFLTHNAEMAHCVPYSGIQRIAM